MRVFHLIITWLALVAIPVAVSAHETVLPDLAPVSPEVKARAWPVDPAKGYVVRELKPTVFMITDGRYQSVFMTTEQGVILFDAPPSLTKYLQAAVSEVTKQPIVSLVYSHGHVDHIGGAGTILRGNPQLEIVAEEGVAQFLQEQKDPNRPVPTKVFQGKMTLNSGAASVELKVGHWHSAAGDLFIYFPNQKVLMAIDTITPGQTTFSGFNLTQNMDEYSKVFDQLLAYDFDVLVTGHRSNPANRDDVIQMQKFVKDVYETAKRASAADTKAVVGQAIAKYGKDNGYALARAVTDSQVAQCESEINARWLDKISNIDVYSASNCQTALTYFQFDVGPRSND
ncbi:MBL fold metallo-hydrolase [Rhizobium sp. C4]|uniref:MBL fold metallo-hydrolase n=1 Tax=Rhizobium sp. C4 TaxID=1349800 RepID=UPI001E5C356C|nr:MBL fold metallo-hydrolase [Rhizobium sp. C4]MCD2174960.1 MBL fold metallo-hydrolase [Rhizobium sp. C4]